MRSVSFFTLEVEGTLLPAAAAWGQGGKGQAESGAGGQWQHQACLPLLLRNQRTMSASQPMHHGKQPAHCTRWGWRASPTPCCSAATPAGVKSSRKSGRQRDACSAPCTELTAPSAALSKRAGSGDAQQCVCPCAARCNRLEGGVVRQVLSPSLARHPSYLACHHLFSISNRGDQHAGCRLPPWACGPLGTRLSLCRTNEEGGRCRQTCQRRLNACPECCAALLPPRPARSHLARAQAQQLRF